MSASEQCARKLENDFDPIFFRWHGVSTKMTNTYYTANTNENKYVNGVAHRGTEPHTHTSTLYLRTSHTVANTNLDRMTFESLNSFLLGAWANPFTCICDHKRIRTSFSFAFARLALSKYYYYLTGESLNFNVYQRHRISYLFYSHFAEN